MAAFPAFQSEHERSDSPALNNGPLPPQEATDGPYELDFARTEADLEAIQRLRFEVFNLEMEEGLEQSALTGRDQDIYDATCDHLFVRHRESGQMVGTYRMQMLEKAEQGPGFYAGTEFDLSTLPDDVLGASVEIGRACIHKDHRSLRVLYLLWKGLGRYTAFHQKRYLFGCCSISSQLAEDAWAVHAKLQGEGRLHPSWVVAPLPSHQCDPPGAPLAKMRPPRLMRTYLSLGATICSFPAIDREFKTIDFLAIFDFESLRHSDLAFYRFHS